MVSGKFTWTIPNYSDRQFEKVILSDVFIVGGCNWWILLYPVCSRVDYLSLSMYLIAAGREGLPSGWSIDAKCSLSVVNQLRDHSSIKEETRHEFTARQSWWGSKSFRRQTELHDIHKRYLLNDTLVVEAEIEVLNVVPPTLLLDTFISNMNKFISDAAQGRNSAVKVGPSLNVGLKSEAPTLEEVEMAKQSLKDCLSDLFSLNIKDILGTSLDILNRATTGLTPKQQKAVMWFWGEFGNFVSDFLTFELDNSEFELHKFGRDQMFSSIKKIHGTYLSDKQRLDDLTKEEEELMKRMEEVKCSKAKLTMDLEKLKNEYEEAKNKYTDEDKKLAEVEEKKRISDKRMSRFNAAWSSLKSHFV